MQTPALAPSLQKLVRYGQNAGRPRHGNDIMLDQLTAMRDAAIALKRNGFTLIGATAGDGHGLPTLQVASDSRTDELVALDLASYYKHETLKGMPRRWGQFADKPNGCRVIFVETPR